MKLLLAADGNGGGGDAAPEKKSKAEKKVRVEALERTTVDGIVLEKGQEGEVTPHQYAALAARLKRLSVLALFAMLSLCAGFAQQLQISALTQTNTALTS